MCHDVVCPREYVYAVIFNDINKSKFLWNYETMELLNW